MKHIKHWLITAAVLLCSVTASAETLASGTCGDNLTWTITEEGELIIGGTGAMLDFVSSSDIPWYTYRASVTKVTIQDGVTNIGNLAFYGTNLTHISIGKDVASIGDDAFLMCSSLTSISIPEGVTEIGNEAFYNCTGLTSVTLPSSLKSIDYSAFYGCQSLISVSMSDGVTSIGNDVFRNCTSLSSITFPASITSIGRSIFYGCTNLTTVTCKSKTPPSTDYSFDSSVPIETLYVPAASLSSYQTSWEYYFTNIKAIDNSVASGTCGTNLIWELTDEGELIIEGTGEMKNYSSGSAPWYEYEVSKVTIKDGVTSIGWYAFYRLSSLTSVSIAGSVESIGAYAFFRCSGLTSITIPEDVTSIGFNAFNGCSSLTSIIIPEDSKLTSFPTFNGCSALTSITIPSSVTNIEGGVFMGCTSLTSIIVAEGNTVYDSRNGCNAIIETSSNMLIAGCSTTIIPSNVTGIGGSAFQNCSSLTSITIPSSVTRIDAHAFFGCSALASLTLLEGVTSIGHKAFHGCSALTSITIPSSVTSMEEEVFNGCTGLTSITLFEGMTSIWDYAFMGCSALTSITIPSSVTSIGYAAFDGCTSLTSITIPGGVKNMADGAFYGCSGLTSITCEAITPPTIASAFTFDNVDKTIPVYVPKSSVADYQAANYWKEFTNIQAIYEEVLATSLTLDVAEASLAPDETLTLNATLLPADVTETTLSWTSSNETVATVDANGVVTAVADGEATITVSTTDGSNLSATCVVTVETEEVGGEVTDSENMIYFEDATAYANTTMNLPLQMKNSADITAVQFDVYLPEGVVIEKTSRGKYNITFNEERTDNSYHTLSAALQEDGAVRVICYSTDSEVFFGNEGVIFNFPLEVPEMEEGDYCINIKNIVLTEQSGKKHEIASMTSTLNVLAVALGDCNRDNAVDVADIVTLANHILNNPVDIFVENAADFNNDNAVDVADIVAIANYILNGNTTAARALTRAVLLTRAVDAGYSFDILPFVLEAEGSKTISLDLVDATESFTAFQCDLYLPEGINIDKNSRGKYNLTFNEERTDNSYHTLSANLQEDGAVRLLCYSTDSEVFMGTDGALVNVPLSADASLQSGVYEFSISNQVLTYQDGTKVDPEAYKGSIIVGDGGEIEDVKLYGRYTAEALSNFSEALSTNDKIMSVDLTDAVSVAESGELTTGNPNTLIYLAEGATLVNGSNVVCGDECANLQLTDGYPFSTPVAFEAVKASYTRTLPNTKWNALYLPFAVSEDVLANYDVASFTALNLNDDNSMSMTVELIDELEANTPYIIRAKDGDALTLTFEQSNVAVEAESNTVAFENGTKKASITGVYAETVASDIDGAYAVSGGAFKRAASDVQTLKSFRLYLMLTDNGNPVQAAALRSIAINVDGEEDATVIDNSELTIRKSEMIYDLQGRRVANPDKGVYIVNGEKVVIK